MGLRVPGLVGTDFRVTCVLAALDTTKDPCQKVKCSRHKVCIAQGYQRAMCISRKKLEHR